MKKLILVLSTIVFTVACGNNASTEKTTETETKAEQPAAPEDPDVEKGLTLITQNDCLTCHQVETAGIGPAYTAIAEKYPNNQQVIDSLSGKIIKGGSGNWGQVMMTAHPTLSEDDAKAMVKYVLSLKK